MSTERVNVNQADKTSEISLSPFSAFTVSQENKAKRHHSKQAHHKPSLANVFCCSPCSPKNTKPHNKQMNTHKNIDILLILQKKHLSTCIKENRLFGSKSLVPRPTLLLHPAVPKLLRPGVHSRPHWAQQQAPLVDPRRSETLWRWLDQFLRFKSPQKKVYGGWSTY